MYVSPDICSSFCFFHVSFLQLDKSTVPHLYLCVADQKCRRHNDCKSGLYCSKKRECELGIIRSCKCSGVCVVACKNFNTIDTDELCRGIEISMFARAAGKYSSRICCTDGTTQRMSKSKSGKCAKGQTRVEPRNKCEHTGPRANN